MQNEYFVLHCRMNKKLIHKEKKKFIKTEKKKLQIFCELYALFCTKCNLIIQHTIHRGEFDSNAMIVICRTVVVELGPSVAWFNNGKVCNKGAGINRM